MIQPVRFERPEKDPETCPIKPIGWRVVIQPFEAEQRKGSGILLPETAIESEQLLTYCGKLVAMGEACYRATTRSGLAMSEWQQKPKVGDWVIYGSYGGQRVFTRSGARYIITNDDAILAVTSDPRALKYYV